MSGYGFDNNGDVLSIAPVLMEKYIAAANLVLECPACQSLTVNDRQEISCPSCQSRFALGDARSLYDVVSTPRPEQAASG